MSSFDVAVREGRRFEFGENWNAFLGALNDDRIRAAEADLMEMLGADDLKGQQFLDMGCGSGLMSLCARRLGASVLSIDYDPKSVQCTCELRRRYFSDDGQWQIKEGSVLDRTFVEALGFFDIVYSWGVLHHTGDMASALGNISIPVKSPGRLFIAIYNDQGALSYFWRKVKQRFCKGGAQKSLVTAVFVPHFFFLAVCSSVVSHGNLWGKFVDYKRHRGMSIYHDWIDWIGGYPFEVAKPEEIIDFYHIRGFAISKLKTTNRLGCNEYVFQLG